MEDLRAALQEWDTNKRVFVECDGKLPEESQERLSFIEMLPPDISA